MILIIYYNLFNFDPSSPNPRTFDFKHIKDLENHYRQNVGDNMTVTDETLNGIAYHQKTKKLLITGKLWNFLYEVAIL